MHRPGLILLILLFTTVSLYAQDNVVEELAQMTSYSDKKANAYLSKKGFRHTAKDYLNDTITDTWEQVVTIQPDSGYSGIRRLVRYRAGNTVSFAMQTPLITEYEATVAALEHKGYSKGPGKQKADSCSFLYQRKNQTILTASSMEEGMPVYTLLFSQKKMPAAKSVVYGEDLLQFTSHAYLEYFFGAANVRRDMYFFSEKELQKCSVLFPNTPQQVVFIWNDEENLNDLSHIIISGTVTTGASINSPTPMSRNTWRTAAGVYVNMPLNQLLSLNDGDFTFFGRTSENYLTILPQRKGRVDFTTTGVVLDCFNCGTYPMLDKQVVSATDAVDNNLRLHVAMIILMPGDEKKAHDQWAKR